MDKPKDFVNLCGNAAATAPHPGAWYRSVPRPSACESRGTRIGATHARLRAQTRAFATHPRTSELRLESAVT
jgi:hypothetical protein